MGKTSVIEQIIRALKPLGYTVSTMKHTHLSIEPDSPGTDTYRHRHAGADTVVLASPKGYYLLRKAPPSTDIPTSVADILSQSDVVLCEGFYRSDMPKVVIESDTADDKTSSEPTDPIILRTRLHHDQDGTAGLSPHDLQTVISYIRTHQKPSGKSPLSPPASPV